MPKIFKAVAFAGALALLPNVVVAQSAAPEPPHGATPGEGSTGAAPAKSDAPAKKVTKPSAKKKK